MVTGVVRTGLTGGRSWWLVAVVVVALLCSGVAWGQVQEPNPPFPPPVLPPVSRPPQVQEPNPPFPPPVLPPVSRPPQVQEPNPPFPPPVLPPVSRPPQVQEPNPPFPPPVLPPVSRPPQVQEPNPPFPPPVLPGDPSLPGFPGGAPASGGGAGNGGGSGSGAPASGVPATGAPGNGASSGSRGGAGRAPGGRRAAERNRNSETIRALSVAGFLTDSVRYLRDTLGPMVIREMRGLRPAFTALGYGLLALIGLFVLWRLASEQEDGSRIPAFIARMVFCAVLIGMSSFLVQTLFGVGYVWTASSTVRDMTGVMQLASPGGGFSMEGPAVNAVDPGNITITTVDMVHLSAIDEWRLRSKERFFAGFEAFRQSRLKVRITNSKLFDPKAAGVEYFIPDFGNAGKEGYVRRFLVGLNPKSWTPIQLYSALELSVLVMQIGIFTGWILLVFIMPLAELVAPVFFAVAIDKGKLFDQMTMPFIRGLLTASLVMPLVNIILEGLAYNIASLGFAVFNLENGKAGTDVFRWDAETEQVVAQADPTVMVFTCCFFIAVSGLSLILSPIIAYRIMSGELFGAAVGAISGWTAGLVSLGVSAISQGVGASFQRQADHLSNVGNYQSSVASAAGAREAAHIRNQAEYYQALTQSAVTAKESYARMMVNLPPSVATLTASLSKMALELTSPIASVATGENYPQTVLLQGMEAGRRGSVVKSPDSPASRGAVFYDVPVVNLQATLAEAASGPAVPKGADRALAGEVYETRYINNQTTPEQMRRILEEVKRGGEPSVALQRYAYGLPVEIPRGGNLTPQQILASPQFGGEVVDATMARKYVLGYETGFQIRTAEEVARMQVFSAEQVKVEMDQAVDIEYGAQVAAANIAFAAGEAAAQHRAEGSFISGVLQAAVRPLSEQIKNNRV